MKKNQKSVTSGIQRRGSTLIIVIALLGLLAFLGMIFFSFASSERSSAEYFSEAAKDEVDEPDNVWDHPLRHIISGPTNRPSEIRSILWSATRRHSLVNNLYGSDLAPFSGEGVHLIYEDDGSGALVPRVDMDWDGTANDEDGDAGEPDTQTLLDVVDSPAARFGSQVRPEAVPAPDVSYTYPDINNMFLAYKGWAIRDNDPNDTGMINPRYERVPFILPSFMRPQYMKTGKTNGPGGSDVPTDLNWASSYDGVNRNTAKFPRRSFRPHPQHIVGFQADGTTPVFRYLTDAEAAAFGISSGGFPFVPEDNLAGQPGGLNGVLGELGILTGSEPDAIELDADPDGDGIREGIWIDTHFPVQEYVDGGGATKLYVVLHSFTIYDLDGLIDLNVHGNIAGLDRSLNIKSMVSSNLLAQESLSKSNLGLGPNEINPVWALRSNLAATITADVARQFNHHFGRIPGNNLEQANMEWLWILNGRAQIDATNKLEDLFAGRWGENNRVFNAFRPGGSFLVADLPRPGRSGDAQSTLSNGIRFGGTFSTDGRDGFDDNSDMSDGEVDIRMGRIRPFGTPLDYAGTGRTHQGNIGIYNPVSGKFGTPGDIRQRLRHHDTSSSGPERFQRFDGYTVGRDVDNSQKKYMFGQNGTFDNCTTASDDLVSNPFLDALFDDPLECIFDAELSQRDFDRVFGPQDIFALHLTAADLGASPDEITTRLKDLSPYALHDGNAPFSFNEQATPGIRGRFTTLSNSLRRFMIRSPFGADSKPGIAGFDDNGDGTIDNLADLTDPGTSFQSGVRTSDGIDNDDLNRAWEFSADTDGTRINNTTGFPYGDGNYEYPPAFGSATNMGLPYSSTDPYRPQVRRLLTVESGDARSLVGQLPLSINHILDVERNKETPSEGTPEFLSYMLRAGMRFRPLTDHPAAFEGNNVLSVATIPRWNSPGPVVFPPVSPAEREFWARRDRQKMARDIYVLLYTTGGGGITDTSNVKNYTQRNDPDAEVGVSLYTHEQLRRMAQFAVNLVDAMDSDNVVTKFEYDKNLGPDAGGTFGGWNMDDDPYATNAMDATQGWNEDGASSDPKVTGQGLYPEDGLERGVVYGVEAQELAFSEVLAARCVEFDNAYSDSPQTAHNDTSSEVSFLHVELQNMRPTTVDITTTVTGTTNENRAVWQLARIDRTSRTAAEPANPTQTLSLMQGNAAVWGGGRFTIGVAAKSGDPASLDPTQWKTSDLYVDYDSDSNFELVSPDGPSTSVALGAVVTPNCDLDVIAAPHAGRWLSSGNSTQPGKFLDATISYSGNSQFGHSQGQAKGNGKGKGKPKGGGGVGTAPDGFDLVVRRRANPNMPQLPLAMNPWIEVDRMAVVFQEIFSEEDPGTGKQMVLHLEDAPSVERSEALDAMDAVFYDAGSDPAPQPWRYNTIGSTINSRSGGGFDLLQNHYDREYSSSAELLHLPVVGPNLLTNRMNRMRYSPYQQVFDDPTTIGASDVPKTANISSAEAMFLQPDFPNLSATDANTLAPSNPLVASVNAGLDNRWYRLLQFVEVPSRVHRMLGNYLTIQKLPGKLNINMIRHREVLAGLLDNPYLADVPPLQDFAPPTGGAANGFEDAPFMTSAPAFAGRDQWRELMYDRDGRPVSGWNPATGATANFVFPGTPNAHPFRSLEFRPSGKTGHGFDETLLRRMRVDLDDDGDGNLNDVDPMSFYSYEADGTPTAPVAPGSDIPGTNRHWLELADSTLHTAPDTIPGVGQSPSAESRHRILSKVLNNTTTVSNTFIVHGVAAYFEAYEDPATGLIRVGGRLDLEPATPDANPGWQQRAVFIIDRTEALEAYDPGSGDFDWSRLVKARATIE